MPSKIQYYRSIGQVAAANQYQRARQVDKNFYVSTRWRKFRAWFLRLNPLCMKCQAKGRTTIAEHVHHVKPRKDHPELAFDETNCEGLCQPCHSAEEVR